MATWRDVDKISESLAEVTKAETYGGNRAWRVRGKLLACERPLRAADIKALGSEAPSGDILAVRTTNLEVKELLLRRDRPVFFTTPHFDGYPTVLIRLRTISVKPLRDVVEEAWLSLASKRAATEFLERRSNGSASRRQARMTMPGSRTT